MARTDFAPPARSSVNRSLGIVALGAEHVGTARHCLVRRHPGDFLLGVGRCGADRINDALGLVGGIEMHQRHLHRLAVGRQGAVEPATVGGRLGQAQATLAPWDTGEFLD